MSDRTESLKALYVEMHGSTDGWLGVEGSYFISGVQAADRLRGGAVPVATVTKLPSRYGNPTVEWANGAAVRVGMRLHTAPPAPSEQPAQGEAVAYEIELRQLRARAEAAEARLCELASAEPVAYGFPNTSITGSGPTMMLLRHEWPSADQYGGRLWIPLIPRPSMEGGE